MEDYSRLDLFRYIDLLLVPVFLYLIYLYLNFLVKTKYKNKPYAKYLYTLVLIHLISGVVTGLLARYYYNNNGDTLMYYDGCGTINELFFENPQNVFNFLSLSTEEQEAYSLDYPNYWYFTATPTTKVIQLAAPFFLITGGSYIGIGFVFSLFSAWGCWRMYKTFLYFYPHLYRELAYGVLFMPSVLFWGSGLLKDPLSLGGLGLFFHAATNIFYFRKKILNNLIILIVGFYAAYFIKPYIILLFIPFFSLWLFLNYKEKIKSKLIKQLVTPILVTLIVLVGYPILNNFAASLSFDVSNLGENVQKNIEGYANEGGGGVINLGEIDPTPMGILKLLPKAANAALFRPYLWEIKNLLQAIAGVESLIIFLFMIYTFIKVGFIKTISSVFSDRIVMLCILFSVVFAAIVGITTFNFGSISRYRIPCIPFMMAGLIIIRYKYKDEQKTITK